MLLVVAKSLIIIHRGWKKISFPCKNYIITSLVAPLVQDQMKLWSSLHPFAKLNEHYDDYANGERNCALPSVKSDLHTAADATRRVASWWQKLSAHLSLSLRAELAYKRVCMCAAAASLNEIK